MKSFFSSHIVSKIPGGKPPRHVLRNILLFLLGSGLFLGGIFFIWLATIQIPDFKTFDERKITNSTKIYDRTGEIALYDIHQDIKRTEIPLEEMGMNIRNATIAIEDADFYQHNGIRIKSILRALFANITRVTIAQGGSTISQQVVKLSLLTDEQTITRKIREAILTLRLEKALTKDEILAIYLNEAPYGGPVYGVQEASKMFFNKNTKDLTVAEAAYLAAITKGPSYYSPYGKHKEELENRKNTVLIKMKEQGYLSEEEYKKAREEKVAFLPEQQGGIKAPHFVFFIKQYLEETYGADVVASQGLKVITTLDYDLQQKAEKSITDNIGAIEKNYNGSNASLVAIDPKNGQILAMVGSRNYFDKKIDGNFNVATALRQPGSSFKPFVYATGFEKGYTPETVLFDVRTEFNASCDPSATSTKQTCYNPDNYDNAFRGPMSIRNALAQSINIPAIKMLYLVGVKDAIKTARDMGIKSLTDPSRYGLTLVIGGGEVSLLDMTNAYATFANNGIYNPATGILKVEDAKGTVLMDFTERSTQAIPSNVALTISDVLSDNTARTPTFGSNSPLVVPGYDVAAKTGTTNNNKDAWTMGYSPELAVGVWVGNNDNTPMKKGGAALAGPIWNQFMRLSLPKFNNTSFEAPAPIETGDKPVFRGIWQGGRSFIIDTVSGKLATEFTPKETRKEIAITDVHDILYWVDKDNPRGAAPANPEKDSQFINWETAVRKWWSLNASNYQIVTDAQIPTAYDDVHIPGQAPILSLLSPTMGTIIPKTFSVALTANGPRPMTRFDYFINNRYAGTSTAPTFTINLDDLGITNNQVMLKVIGYDSIFNKGEIEATFTLE